MRFANRTELERLRSEYPVGCRIVLDEMDDPYRQMPAGLQGVCRGIDDAGNILASWDNGSTLSVLLILGILSVHIIPTGYTGVKTSFGQIQQEPIQSGTVNFTIS